MRSRLDSAGLLIAALAACSTPPAAAPVAPATTPATSSTWVPRDIIPNVMRQAPPPPAGPTPRVVRPGLFAHHAPVREVVSPDGTRAAGARDGHLYLRPTSEDEQTILAPAEPPWRWDVEGARWSPDGARLAAIQIDDSRVPRIPLVDWQTEEVRWIPYSRAGQPLPTHRIVVIDVASGRTIPVPMADPSTSYLHPVGFSPDGARFRYFEADRFARRLDLVELELSNQTPKRILRETSQTHVLGLEVLYGYAAALDQRALVRFFDARNELVWTSERSGFRHLYAYDLNGERERALTEGKLDGPVERVVAVDRQRGRVFFTAHGDRDAPYAEQLYRVDLDGGDARRLSDGPVITAVDLAADGDSLAVFRAGLPNLLQQDRVSAEGNYLATEWRADWSFLDGLELDARRLVVPAADGETELDAMLFLPPGLDETRRYPVVEMIYGGPHTRFVPSGPQQPQYWEAHYLAAQGYAVAIIDARGTPGRGKAFADTGYGTLGHHVIADHQAAMRHILATHPYLDEKQVAVMGHSWGGHFALRAALEAPDLYRAAIVAAPGFELEHFRVAIEPYMGCVPADCPDAYRSRAITPRLSELKAPILILHGTADDDEPLAEGMKMAAALDAAGRSNELVVAPGANHIVQRWPHYWRHVLSFLARNVKSAE